MNLKEALVWRQSSGKASNSLMDFAAAAAAKSLQSCPTLCDPTDGSPPGCPIPGILQARTLEWVVISFSNAWKWKVKVKSLSRVRLLADPWTAAYQAPPSMGFSRQEYWSGVSLPSLLMDFTGVQKQVLFYIVVVHLKIQFFFFLWLWGWYMAFRILVPCCCCCCC